MAEPRCPDCRAIGIDKITYQPSLHSDQNGNSWYEIVHCGECGHVYGVFAKRVIDIAPPKPLPPSAPGG